VVIKGSLPLKQLQAQWICSQNSTRLEKHPSEMPVGFLSVVHQKVRLNMAHWIIQTRITTKFLRVP